MIRFQKKCTWERLRNQEPINKKGVINLNEIALKSFSEFVKLEDFTEKYESYNEDKNTNQKTIQNNIGKFFIDGTSPYFAYVYILKMVNPNKIDYSEK